MGRLIDADKLIEYWLTPPMNIGWDDEIEDVNNQPTVEAIPKADYENRLKADLKSILVELQLEIEELDVSDVVPEYQDGAEETKDYIANMIEEKINALRGDEHGLDK